MGKKPEQFNRGRAGAGSQSIIMSCLDVDVQRAAPVEEETKSSSKYAEMRKSV